MTISYIEQDVTHVTSPAIILHGVNCQGVMGAGVAKAIRDKWPVVKLQYETLCDCFYQQSHLGGLCQPVLVSDDIIVCNLFTQINYGSKTGTRYADPDLIFIALTNLARLINSNRLPHHPIYTPKIGCGLGGLNWDKDVKHIFNTFHDYITFKSDANLYICEI